MSTPLRVLIVEDSQADTTLLLLELRNGGFAPSWVRVETPAALQAALDGGEWDLIVSDFFLPRLSGADALQIVRQRGLDVPFLVVSGTIGEEKAVEMMRTGADDYIMKSNLARLVPAVQRELREAETRRQHKRAEHQLYQSEQRLRLALEAAQMGTWDWDVARNQLSLSERIYDLFQIAPEVFNGSAEPLLQRVHPEDVEPLHRAICSTVPGDSCRFEFRIIRPDGQIRWLFTQGKIFRDQHGQAVRLLGVVQDVTERKRAEEEVRAGRERLLALSRQLLEVQEKERRHIARELHDEIGQGLTAATLSVQMVQRLADVPQVRRDLQDCATVLDRTLQQVRAMSLDLRPSMLDDLGLAPALRWYLDGQAQRSGLHIQLTVEPAGARLPGSLETVCFRLVQEAVTNVVRHARARQVRVALWTEDGEAKLRISDDGIGFDVAQARSRAVEGSSLGLLSMQERTLLVGGRFALRSQPGDGTEISVALPLLSPATPSEIGGA
jgi:two-component system sensor histidine kinase UhpB